MTVVLAAFVLAPRLSEGRVLFDGTPDKPCAFGYKMAWLAIRTKDTGKVAQVLGLVPSERANWRTGIGTVYDDDLGEARLYLSPPVNGWTFVVGLSLPYPVSRIFVDKCTPMLLDLGAAFPEVQYYFSYPLLDFFAWARISNGKLVRAFAIGDEGIIWNKGKPTREEKSLGLKLFEVRGVRGRKGDAVGDLIVYPTESHVIHLAASWSVDPTILDRAKANSAAGYICPAPLAWRPERLRKTA